MTAENIDEKIKEAGLDKTKAEIEKLAVETENLKTNDKWEVPRLEN
ncbi:MAG: hypothetical protein ABWZ66_01060 [Pyrinomonadaceae bacterium]